MTQGNVQKTKREVLAAEATRLRADGLKYREVAASLGISTSYAQELVVDPAGEAVRHRRYLYAERHSGECVDCGKRVTSGNRPEPPKRCTECEGRRKQAHGYWIERNVSRHFSDADLLEHLRACHAEQGRASSNAYLVYKRQHPEAPSQRTLMIRFGSWWEAVERAGFQPGPHRRGPGRFTADACLEAIRLVAAALKRHPSIRSYARYRQEHPEVGLPCDALIRGHFDNSWSAAVEAALNDATPVGAGATNRSDIAKGKPIG